MRRIPIRIRLTAWFVAVIAAALVVLGSFVVTRLRADLTNEVDRALTVTAAQITEAYRDEGPGEFADATRETIAAPSSRTLGAQVLDDRGRVVHAVGAELIRSRVPSLELAMSAKAGTTYIASFTVTGTHLRAISVPVQVGDGRGAVIVAEPLDDVDTAVRQALGLLLVGGSVALLLAGLGGWHVARRALHPVERMAIRAEKVDIEDLDQRIPVPPADDELRHLAQTLNAMLDRIQEGVAARERLIADTSHELRGPLAAMRAEIDVSLRHDEIAPVTRALLKSQREEVVRLSRIVDNLLTLARMDDGHLELLRSPHDLLELAHRSARTHAASAEAAGVELAVTGEATPVSCDRDRIEQVIGNLLDNAIRVSPRSGTVRIRVTRDGQCAFLEVTDDGPGVPPPERTRIFERFARIDPARGRVGGAGLGLAISREIVAAHGGRLELSTGDETGSTFTMTLDTVEPDVAAPASP